LNLNLYGNFIVITDSNPFDDSPFIPKKYKKKKRLSSDSSELLNKITEPIIIYLNHNGNHRFQIFALVGADWGPKASATIDFIRATEALRKKPHITSVPLKMY
jgi:hypothetical protein